MNLNDLPDMSDALRQVQMYEAKKKGDGDLANNAVPYNKVTQAEIITGALGRDEKGGKEKPKGHDCAKLVKYAPNGSVKESFETVPEMHTLLEDGTVTHYDIVSLDGNMTYFNVPVEDLEIVISEKHEHFVNYDKNAEVLGEDAKYDRNRKRAAQRAAARNAARDAGRTGVVPGVGYVSPRRERETYVDSAGVTRHKSGAKNEEVENIEEVLSGERYKKVMNKPGGTAYSRKVSADPSKRATRGGRGGESDFGAGDRGSGNRARRRAGTYQEYNVNEAFAFSDAEWEELAMLGEEIDAMTDEQLIDFMEEINELLIGHEINELH